MGPLAVAHIHSHPLVRIRMRRNRALAAVRIRCRVGLVRSRKGEVAVVRIHTRVALVRTALALDRAHNRNEARHMGGPDRIHSGSPALRRRLLHTRRTRPRIHNRSRAHQRRCHWAAHKRTAPQRS